MTYRVGISGKQYIKKIPFYAKLSGFLYRDWCYKGIVGEIMKGGQKISETEKALRILRWTNDNIKADIPLSLKVYDDHPLNIIIRQYGAGDQIEDVFTILCSYAGMEAGMAKCYAPGRKRFKIFSLVKLDNRQLIFIAGKNKYFVNKKNDIGSVQDYINGDLSLSEEERALYGEYLADLKNIDLCSTRAEEQMPFRRLGAELKKRFKGKRAELNYSQP